MASHRGSLPEQRTCVKDRNDSPGIHHRMSGLSFFRHERHRLSEPFAMKDSFRGSRLYRVDVSQSRRYSVPYSNDDLPCSGDLIAARYQGDGLLSRGGQRTTSKQ
jgi:hypothetical protein